MPNIVKIEPDASWTHEEHVFVALFIEIGKVVPAAVQAFSIADPVKAGRMGNAFLTANRSVLQLVLERQGLTMAALAVPIKDALTANKRTYAKYQGELGQHADDVDHTTRLAAAKLGYEVIGHLNRHKHVEADEAQGSTGPVILPVRPGMDLPATAMILEGDFTDSPTEGGGAREKTGGHSDSDNDNASPRSEVEKITGVELLSEKKVEIEEEEEW